MLPKSVAWLSLVALTALAVPARAATVEPKVKLLMRERPSSNARIVNRIPAGKKLKLLGRSEDGGWAHVADGRHDGWVPSEQLRGNVRARKATTDESADDDASDEPVRPLAKPRHVRPEAWVSKSRYHDGEDNKLTVSATKAELYGRPALGGSVIGILRRGETVSLLRKSEDHKWCLVDIGGGDVAWLQSKSVKPGAAKGAPIPETTIPEEEAPRTRKLTKRERQREFARTEETQQSSDSQASNDANGGNDQSADNSQNSNDSQSANDSQNSDDSQQAQKSRGDDEAPPIADSSDDSGRKSKHHKKGTRVASRGDLDGLGADAAVERHGPSHRGNNAISIGARGGFAILDQRFTSNGSGLLTNYEASTSAFGIAVSAGYTRAIGHYFRLGIDAGYSFAGAAGVKYHSPQANGDVVLGEQAHQIGFGLSPGVHFDAIGGVDLKLRLGGEFDMNLIQSSTKVPLPSDVVAGMAVGLGIGLPELFHFGGRAFGLYVLGGLLAPATRMQTGGLAEGATSSTIGGYFGGGLHVGLYKGLALAAAYTYSLAVTHFSGTPPQGQARNLTISSADRGSAQHLITLGLGYDYGF